MSDDQERPDGEVLTLAAAAAEVGWKGTARFRARRMRRLLETKEREVGRAIMTRIGTQGDRTVTRGALRRYCPELFETSIEVFSRGFRGMLRELDMKLARRIEEHPKIQGLDRRTRALRRDLNDLTKRVVKLA